MAEIIDLNINIGANTTDFESSLQKAQNLLKQFEAALKKATNVGEINYLNGQIKNLNATIATLGQQMNKVGRPAGDATNALTNLSRVAQDAPYGFIGIANNLNPLLESFQRLQKESGSSALAFKAMAAGLVGPAGIGLALGVVSSLAVTFGKDIAAFFKGPTEKLKEFRAELAKISQDLYKVVGEAQANRTIGLNLVSVIAGGSAGQQEEALKKLKVLYKDSKDIQALKIGADNAYMTHLVNMASKQEEYNSKEKNSSQALNLIYENQKKIIAERDQALKNVKGDIVTGGGPGGGASVVTEEQQIQSIKNKYNPILKELEKQIVSAKTKNLELVTALSTFETTDSKGGTKKDKKDPFSELTKDFEKDLKAQETLRSKSLIDQQTYLDNVYKIYEDYIKKLAELDTTAAKNKIESLLPKFDKMTFDKNALSIKNGIKDMLDSYQEPKMDVPEDTYAISQKKLEEARNKYGTFFLGIKEKNAESNYEKEKEKIEDLNKSYEKYANTISQTVTGALFGMFDAMEQGASASQALGEMFSNLLRQLAEMVIKAAIFSAIMSALNPASAGQGGLSFLGNFTKLLGLADGGIATGPTLAMIGEGSESEAVLPLSKLGNIMQGSFNAGSMNGNSMGQNGQFVLRGQDLVLAMQRSNSSLNIIRG
jgi:hypothetical protein